MRLHTIIRAVLFVLAFCALTPHYSQAQEPRQLYPFPSAVDTLVLTPLDTVYTLQHRFLVAGSEAVLLDTAQFLRLGFDYAIAYSAGTIRFSRSDLLSILADGGYHIVVVSYTYIPVTLQSSYSLRKIDESPSRGVTRRRAIVPTTESWTTDDFFGPGLRKSGSLLRGFTVGSNRDLSLNSGFRMQLAGPLSNDVEIIASLTDQNTPIQPEGTTQALREVDNVFVQIRNPTFGATLGDFEYVVEDRTGGEFARLKRKLQGGAGEVRGKELLGSDVSGMAKVVGASPRGKYVTNFFQGVEGNQGPYRLTGTGGERQIIVIAGSERVYVNGFPMVRGEVNDYVIDYSTGEIRFTSKQLITSASRVTVDFEYSDRQYERGFLSGTGQVGLFNNTLMFNAVYVQEGDDPDAPINTVLDAQAREILAASGPDRLKASRSGVTYAGIDTATGRGIGQYISKDTTIDGATYQIFEYAPGDSLAFYRVTFSRVDPMPPDSVGYIRMGIGYFKAAGVGKGTYLPVDLIPIPQNTRLLDLNLSGDVIKGLNVTGEYAVSDFDANRLSSLDDDNRIGHAVNLGMEYRADNVALFGTNLGGVRIGFQERFVQKEFITPDRVDEIEFDRNWDLETDLRADEEIREFRLGYEPVRSVSLSAGYGFLTRESLFRSDRARAGIAFTDSSLPLLNYELLSIKSRDRTAGFRNTWLRHRGGIEYQSWVVDPFLRVETEERVSKVTASDSIRQGSFSFLELTPGVKTDKIAGMTMGAEFQIRREDSAAAGQIERAYESLAQRYSWTLSDWNSLSTRLLLSLKKTQFTEAFKQRGNVDTDVTLLRFETYYNPLARAVQTTLFYEFSDERSSLLERVFVKVEKGKGNYAYLGDLNGNGVADEEEFSLTRFDGEYVVVLVPGETLVPVINLRSSIRLRLEPSRILRTADTWFMRALQSVSTETYFRVDEKSTDRDVRRLLLLDFSRFQNDSTTISGVNQFTQDVYLFENTRSFSTRLRFSQRTGLLQLVSGKERSYARERSVRLRSQLIPEIGNITEFVNRTDLVDGGSTSLRSRNIIFDELSSDFSYRPDALWEVGFRLAVARSSDTYGGEEAQVDMNDQTIRLTYSIPGSGQLQGEVRREEVTLGKGYANPNRILPFELTSGKPVGKSLLWLVTMDYRISTNIQVTLSYQGRTEAGEAAIHSATATAQAFF